LQVSIGPRSETRQGLLHGSTSGIEDQNRRYTMFKRILGTLTLLGVLGMFAGCNTVEGMGKDIERGGEATQDAAKDVKKNM
jgi:entericidin B